jgi:filamentous hemagglutinin family protein
MNHIHRSIWNEQTGTFVAVAENTRSAGKKISSCTAGAGTGASFRLQTLAVSLMLACGASAYAQPVGGVVSAGSATIGGAPGSMTITQTTPNVAINWQSFGIKAGESVQFVQPASSSVALNRVVGADPSGIFGSLTSNGKVFLVNPNGVLFGHGASVNVGGLVASTLAITDANFMANNYKFSGAGAGTVLNQGAIHAADGGYVALLGANVSNQGVVTAQLGTVALAAGNAVTLDMAGDKLLNVVVDQGVVNALVENGGLLQADGGLVLMTTQAAGSLLANAVNNTGVVQAQTLVTGESGSIQLLGGMANGTLHVAGTLDASAPAGGNGGFVETSAAQVKIANGVQVTTAAAQGKTGTWLIDPPDFTIGVGGDIEGAALETSLLTSNVTILSNNGSGGAGNGDIHVNQAVTWAAPTTLTLDAVRDVNVKQAMTGTNGSLVAKAGRDVNVDAAITTTTGHLSFQAINDVNVNAATTITTGNLTAVAGKNVNINAAMTVTTGNMVLRADNDGTGPGATAGTVSINCGPNCLTIGTGQLSIRFNPVTYASTGSEISAYQLNLTGGGTLDAKAWVFGKGDNKIYDGTTTATVGGFKPDAGGVVPTATLGAVSNANFDTKHVGTNKLITYESTFSNAVFDLFAPAAMAAGTYVTRADILVRPLTVNAVTDTRVYNGTTSSVGVPTVVDLQPGDTLTGTLTQAYASKNVMGTNGSTLVANGPYAVADGNGGNNYTVTVNTAPGTITPAPLTLKANDATKTYGTTFAPAGSAFTTPVVPVAGETVTSVVETSTGSAPTASVAGGAYPIVITPGSATGANGFVATNYTITYLPGALSVLAKALTGSITASDKVYDATTAATITARTLVGVVGSDAVTYTGGTGAFDTAAVGTGKTVTGTGLGLSGADAGNYTVNTTATTTAAITAVVTPPVEPPVVVPPVVPPVVVPPVVPPVVIPPVVPPVVVPPVVPPVNPPVEPPVVLPPVWIPPTPPVVTPPGYVLTVVTPSTPPSVLVVETPPVVVPAVVPVEKLPAPYQAPVRQPKPERN